MAEEDPTFRIETNTETNQTLISGVGKCNWMLSPADKV